MNSMREAGVLMDELDFFREQSLHSPRVSEHRGPLDEAGNLLQQTETYQQQRNQQQHFTGET